MIGSERHESRRIDNQLRGRAARQGDPGSSRFYLSMEDELMRLFGGQQAEGMMVRMGIDDAMPLEVGLVGRLVEQSQSRVEGANFDVRKHLLEYDDVLNTQRAKIYDQRDLIFVKDDLSENVTEMLQTEVLERVPLALEDPEGPWKLLAWLDQIQPPLTVNGYVYPSYMLRLLVDQILDRRSSHESYLPSVDNQVLDTIDRESARLALTKLAEDSLKAEEEHILISVNNLLEVTRQRFEEQLEERLETLDTYLEGLELEESGDARGPRQIVDEISSLVQIPLKLSSEEKRALQEDPDLVVDSLGSQIAAFLVEQSVTRLIGAVERRLEEDLDIDKSQLVSDDWDTLTDQLLDTIQTGFERRLERLIGDDGKGQIPKDLEKWLEQGDGSLNEGQLLGLLIQMPQGARASFDKRTHRRVWQRTTRLTYYYAAANLLENQDPEEETEEILAHLETAQSAMRYAWGSSELSRLAASIPVELEDKTQKGLRTLFDENRYAEISEAPLSDLTGEEKMKVIDELGRQALTEIYRQLILGVISELWVEYLTSMEALRVSIGLEAYAQRDPLVQYKNRAFEMFRELLDNTRTGVVTRMFIYRPRDLSSVQSTVSTPRAEPPELTIEAPQPSPAKPEKAKGKKKRRRRRRK